VENYLKQLVSVANFVTNVENKVELRKMRKNKIKEQKVISRKEFIKMLIDKLYELLIKSDRDEKVYGNSFFDITDRKIELIEPNKVNLTKKRYIITEK